MKGTDQQHSVRGPAQPPPLRTAQLTAALGKAWVQPKLSFTSKLAKNTSQPRAQQGSQAFNGHSIGPQGTVAAEQLHKDSVAKVPLGAAEEASSTVPMNLGSPYSGETLTC